MPGVVKPMRVLWNEVIGFLFLVMGVIFASGAIRQYRMLKPEEITPLKMGLLFVMPAIMLYFGVTSFLRARRISRL